MGHGPQTVTRRMSKLAITQEEGEELMIFGALQGALKYM
jgi:hypothetical protein